MISSRSKRRSWNKPVRLSFSKMHGCGNDFLVCEALSRPVTLEATTIKRLADRHFGVGFDQLLLIEPPLRPKSDFALAIYNSDGSQAGHCGNGARCVARFVFDNAFSHKQALTWDVASEDGPLDCFVTRRHSEASFTVEMGVPSFSIEKMPSALRADARQAGEFLFVIDTAEFTPVHLGNLHAVFMVDNTDTALVDGIEGVNAGYCQVIDREHLKLRVFERGVGETLACGSGACAAAAAAHILGRTDASVSIDVPGGMLEVDWRGTGTTIELRGPAQTCFRGSASL